MRPSRLSCCRFRGHRERCFMEPEVGDGTTAIYARVQARGGPPDQGSRRILCAGIARPWGTYVAAALLGEEVCGRSASGLPWSWSAEARAGRDRAVEAGSDEAEGGTGHPKKSRGLLREGQSVKFAFIAKHRGIWPAGWMCGALGVSRGGFYAWLTRPPSHRSRSDEALTVKVRTSFIGSDRTYGARRIWKDVLADGVSCGLHRIERLMRQQALRARPRRRRLPSDIGERQAGAVAPNVLGRSFNAPAP